MKTKDFFIKLVSKILPFPKLRRSIINNHNNNKIIVVTADGRKIQKTSIKGLKISFRGCNNYIEIHEPYNFIKCHISCNKNMTVTIGTTNIKIQQLHISGADLYCHDCRITIGNNFFCAGALLFPSKNGDISIGDNCMFSWGISIWANDGHHIYDKGAEKQPTIEDLSRNVIIGNNIWVCMNANILKGSVIPNGSVVGMNALVAGKYDQENIVLGGNPAKIIRENITWRM